HDDAGAPADLPRPRAGRVDHAPRLNRSARRLDASNAIALDANAGHFSVALNRDAERLSRLRKAQGDTVRIGNAVAAAERGAEHARCVEPGNETRCFDRIEPFDVDAKAPLPRDVSP